MRRLALFLAVVLVALTISSVFAQDLGFPRHVDPLTLPEKTGILEVVNLLNLASELLAELDVGRATNVTQLLATAPVPRALREAYMRFLALFSNVTNYLNNTLTSLDLAEEALSRGELSNCRILLQEAEEALSRAYTTYTVLRDTYDYLARMLGPTLSRQAGKSVENVAKALEGVSKRLEEVRKGLEEALARGLTEVLIEVRVNSTRALYGDFVEVWGRVVDAYGKPLIGRRVVASYPLNYSTYSLGTLTDKSGSFRLVVPLQRCGNITLVVAYTPLGEDVHIYRYSEARLNLTVACRVPVLRLTLPEVIYVGTPTTLCVNSNVDGLEVSVAIVSTNVSTTLRLPSTTCTTIRVPEGTGEGVYKVVALSKPLRGVPPVKVTAYVNVTRIPLAVTIQHPKLLLTGLPAEVCVNTEVPSEVSLVYLATARTSTSTTTTCVPVEVPVTYLDAELPLSIYIKPLNSTYREALLKLRLYTVNLYMLASTVLAVALLILLHREGAVYTSPQVSEVQLREVRGTEVAEVSPLVAEFVEVVRSLSGVELERDMTLREYVGRALNLVGENVRGVLRSCLAIVERIIYGPQVGVEALVKEFREMLKVLRRGLSAGVGLYVLLGLLTSFIIISAVVYLVPSTDDLSPHNPLWNGLSRFTSEFNVSTISVRGITSLNPGSSALLIIGISGEFEGSAVEALRGFIQGGGVLVVADEGPHLNNLVRSLGVGASLGGTPIADTLFMYRDPHLPLARARLSTFNLTLYLNYPTYLNTTRMDRCVAWSFPTSFLDLNLSGSREGSEPYGPFCVAYRERIGSGVVYVVSDSSIFINSMIGLGDNMEFLRAVLGGRSTYILYEGGASSYSRFRELLLGTYSTLLRTWLRYPLSVALALALYKLATSFTKTRRAYGKPILPGLPSSSKEDFEKRVGEVGELEVV